MKINLKKIFNWDIQSVSYMDCRVEPMWRDENGVRHGGSIRSLSFCVNYVHHGQRKFVFDGNDEHLYTTYGNPVLAANAVQKMYIDAMMRQRARKAARMR